MKRKDRSLFSKNKKKEALAPEATVPAVEACPPAPETVRVGYALHFPGAPEPMPIVDDRLFLYTAPEGDLVISPQCDVPAMMVLWRDGENWLVHRLCQGKLLCNGFEAVGDIPVLLQSGVCVELVGHCAFTFLEIREPVLPETAPAEEPAPIGVTVPVGGPDIAEELAKTEEAPFDWTPFLPVDDPEPVEMPALEPVADTVLADAPQVAEEIALEEDAFDWTPVPPADEPDPIGVTLPVEEPDPIGETIPIVVPDPIGETLPVAEPEVVGEPVAPFDWTPFLPVDEPEIVPAPVHEMEPEIIPEPVPEMVPVFEEQPVLPEFPASGDPLVAALERLASGDREVLQSLPELLAQKDLYCWGGFNFLGVYLQPIPAVRPADWSGDADALDELGWEPRPGMVIPLFTCEEEAVKRDCPLGAFPSANAPTLFAKFVEMGLDLELDPFGDHPVRVPAAAVRDLSETLGGGAEKFRWIRRTLPW